MSIAITCPCCGQSLQVAADDARQEIECLWCGSRCPIPKKTSAPAPSRPPAHAGKPPAPPAEPEEPARMPQMPRLELDPPPEPEPANWMEQTPYALLDPTGIPYSPPPPAPAKPARTSAVAEASVRVEPELPAQDDEDDGSPYGVGEVPQQPCVECGRFLPADAILCPSCGFHQKTRTRVRRKFEPIERVWESGLPLERRRRLFLLGQAVAVPLAFLTAYHVFEHWSAFLVPWLTFSLLTGFLLGTYSRVNLSRNKKGRIHLSQTWRVFFRERPTTVLRTAEYEGVVASKARDADFWDWVLLFLFLGMGIVPGVLWYYFAIWKDSFFLALAKDHGHPAVRLYQGWDEDKMKDIARTLCTAAGWRCPV
jgi:hypothetical protein